MHFHQIYDPGLSQYAYLIGCEATNKAILVDPERDVDRYLKLADERGLTVEAVVETHIHADFLSGARELAERVGLKVSCRRSAKARAGATTGRVRAMPMSVPQGRRCLQDRRT
jgi:hydroxyacylglutathione hydrolase